MHRVKIVIIGSLLIVLATLIFSSTKIHKIESLRKKSSLTMFHGTVAVDSCIRLTAEGNDCNAIAEEDTRPLTQLLKSDRLSIELHARETNASNTDYPRTIAAKVATSESSSPGFRLFSDEYVDKPDRTCRDFPAGNFTRRRNRPSGSASPPVSLHRLVKGEGWSTANDTSKAAVCRYTLSTLHFPHFMQQIVRCWSFWQRRLPQPSVLLVPSTLDSMKRRQENFLQGMLEALTNALNVSIVSNHTDPSVEIADGVAAYAFARLEDAVLLRNAVISYFAPQAAALLQKEKDEKDTGARPLRIGILNRRGGRRILNEKDLQGVLQRHTDVTVADFEKASFADQVSFYAMQDIVISSHGAQVTGVLFMPTCAGLLELFPQGYCLPQFFGSLALYSGLEYGYIYLSDGNSDHETKEAKRTLKGRIHARKLDLCPPVGKVVDAVEQLIEARRQCLRQTI